MCFGAKPSTPTPTAPPIPPSQRDADMEGTRKRQEAARLAKVSGSSATDITKGTLGGVPATVGKPTLGA